MFATNKSEKKSVEEWSFPNQMREEDLAEGTSADSDEADRINRPENAIPTIGRRPRTLLESLAEGGVILLNQATKIARSNAGIVKNLATTKRSAERRNESRLQPVDNSRTINDFYWTIHAYIR